MTLSAIDQTIIVIYLLATAGIGFYFARRNKSTDEYFAGGRSHGGLLLGLSLVGASISSVTFVALPADTFRTAWYRYLPNLALPIAIAFAAVYFVPLYRRARVTSAYEYLETRFGPGVRVYAAAMFAVGQLIRLSVVLFLLSVVVHAVTGVDPHVCILAAGLLTAAYTLVGGLNAVIWTDAIQTVVLLGGGVTILWTILSAIPGGLSEVFSFAWANGKLSFSDLVNGRLQPTSWVPDLFGKSASLMLLYGLVAWLTEYITNQGVVQRYTAARSEAEARRSIWICAIVSLPTWAMFMFMGTALYVYYQHHPDPQVAEMLNGTRKAEEVLPYFLVSRVPVGIAGLVVAGIMAAAMSTLSSCMNAFASVMVVDLYRRKVVPGRDDRHYLRAGWFFTGVSAAVMVLGALALLHARTKTLNDFITLVTAIVSAGMLGIFLLGFLTVRANVRSVGCGILLTVAYNVWCTLSGNFDLLPPNWKFPFDLYYSGILGNALMFAAGYAMALLLPARRNAFPVDHLTVWGRDNHGGELADAASGAAGSAESDNPSFRVEVPQKEASLR